MTITLNGTTGITTPAVTNDGAYTGDGVVFADSTPSNTLVTDTSGNVRIGSTSINNNKLLVKGAHTSGRSILAVQTNDATSGSSVYVGFYNSSDSRIGVIGCDTASNMQIGAIENVPMTFATNNTERMRIDSSGNLLVGTTSLPSTSGGNYGAALIKTQSGSSFTGRLVLGHGDATGARIASFWYGTTPTNIGNIDATTTSTSYGTSSDYRLKENIQPMTGALAKVALLKPCTYTWKSNGELAEGFIAHELAEVAPACVSGEKDAVNEDGSIKAQSIDTSFLVATLTAAIQELKAELDTVKTELATLKGTV